jgi:hypothetical protein
VTAAAVAEAGHIDTVSRSSPYSRIVDQIDWLGGDIDWLGGDNVRV